MRRNYRTQSLIAEINITPFTDVILVLLIIFMIATPLISQSGIVIKLPEAASRDISEESKTLAITISGEGVVYIDSKVVTTKELRQKISAFLEKDSDLKVMVAADQDCRFQDVVRVIDTLKELGVRTLNIATRPNN